MADLEVLPKCVNYADQKPMAVKSYVRRFKNPSENIGAAYTPGNEIRIPIDSGTPGAYLDQKQSYLEFQITITNTNPYIDYVNLTSAGFNACFRRMALQVNGTDCEVIEDYNKVVELLGDLEGECRDEFSLYVTNPLNVSKNSYGAVGTTSSHLGNVKYPMCDYSGKIMYNLDGLQTFTTSYGLPVTADAPAWGQLILANCTGWTAGSITGVKNWYRNGLLNPQSQMDASTYTGVTSATAPSSTYYLNPTNILAFPDCIPPVTVFQDCLNTAGQRIQDRLTYYKNVRCIPVGMSTIYNTVANTGIYTVDFGTTVPVGYLAYNTGIVPINSANSVFLNNGVFTTTVEAPILSGIVGALCDKMLPTFLMGTVELILTIDYACKVFSITMDPCRRLFGTRRDYLVYNPVQRMYGRTSPYGAFAGAYSSQFGALANSAGSSADMAYYFAPYSLIPQYVLTSSAANNPPPAWINSNVAATTVTGNNYAIGWDGDAAYGTFLESSVAQTWRTIGNGIANNTWTGLFSAAPFQGQSNYPSFTIQNVYYVAQQIILPDNVSRTLIDRTASTELSILTYTYKTYTSQLQQGSGDQSILIPAKLAEANAFYMMFQMNSMIDPGSPATTWLYDSMTRICPIGSKIYSSDGSSYIGTNNAPVINQIPAVNTGNRIFSIQLRIGNDLLPAQPMSTIPELINEIEKTQHGLYNKNCTPALYAPLVMPVGTPSQVTSNVSSAGAYYDICKSGFTTTWIDTNYLNDQTILNNYAWGLASSYQGGAIAAPLYSAVQTGTFMESAFFTPQRGYFFIGLDLDTWSGYSDVSMSGRYLGNNNVSLNLTGFQLANAIANGNSANILRTTAIIQLTMRMSFQAGGNFQTFY